MISIHPPSSKLLAIRPAEKWREWLYSGNIGKGFLFGKGTTSPKINRFACAIADLGGGEFRVFFLILGVPKVPWLLIPWNKGEKGKTQFTLLVYLWFGCFFCSESKGWSEKLEKRIPLPKTNSSLPQKIGRNPGEEKVFQPSIFRGELWQFQGEMRGWLRFFSNHHFIQNREKSVTVSPSVRASSVYLPLIHTSKTPRPVFRCFKKSWKKHRNPISMGISGCLKIPQISPWKWFYCKVGPPSVIHEVITPISTFLQCKSC